MVYCNAGQNPPLVIRAAGVRRLERGGPIVGLFEGATYEEDRQTLTPGDWLIVFSDGIRKRSRHRATSPARRGSSTASSATGRWIRHACSMRCSAMCATFPAAPRRATTSRRWCRSIRATARHKPAHHAGRLGSRLTLPAVPSEQLPARPPEPPPPPRPSNDKAATRPRNANKVASQTLSDNDCQLSRITRTVEEAETPTRSIR